MVIPVAGIKVRTTAPMSLSSLSGTGMGMMGLGDDATTIHGPSGSAASIICDVSSGEVPPWCGQIGSCKDNNSYVRALDQAQRGSAPECDPVWPIPYSPSAQTDMDLQNQIYAINSRLSQPVGLGPKTMIPGVPDNVVWAVGVIGGLALAAKAFK